MRLFDEKAFLSQLEAVDDSKVKYCLEEYGVSNVPNDSDEEMLELFKPFFEFSKADKPADIDIKTDELVSMADKLEKLVDLFTGGNNLNGEGAMRNILSVKGVGRRRVV